MRRGTVTHKDRLLSRLSEKDLLHPVTEGATIGNRTALVRIISALLGTLGFLWAEHDQEIIITDAGFAMLRCWSTVRLPALSLRGRLRSYSIRIRCSHRRIRKGFGGLIPHVFLLQVLQDTDGYVTFDEQELFVNLATEQDDVAHVVRYVQHWRNLSSDEQNELREIFRTMPTIAAPGQG